MFIIELFEGDVKLDGATITVQVYEPEAIVDEEKGMLSTLILPGVGGLVLGLLIFGATLQIIRMRSAGKEGQESFSSTLKDSTPTPLQPMTMAAPPPPSSAISAVQSPIIDDDKCQVDENGIKWFNDDDGIWWYKSPDMVDWMKR